MFGRESEHEKAAEPKPKPKTPDVDLGCSSPCPLPANTTPVAHRENRNPRAARPAEPGTLAALDRPAAGETMIDQAAGRAKRTRRMPRSGTNFRDRRAEGRDRLRARLAEGQ